MNKQEQRCVRFVYIREQVRLLTRLFIKDILL